MWPKALLELLPHLTRLVPMLNRYFQSRSAIEEATRLALENKIDELGAALRRDLGEASRSSPELVETLRDQANKTAALREDVISLRASLNAQDDRFAHMEKQQRKQQFLLVLAVLLLALLLIALPLVLRHR